MFVSGDNINLERVLSNTVKEKKKYRLFPKKISLKLLLLLDLVVAGFFMVMMTLVDAFPKKLVVLILVLLFALLVLIWRLLSSKKKRTKRRITGVILSVIFIAGFGLVSYYLVGTYNMFSRITNIREQHEYFYVVAPADSPYDEETDLSDMTVFIVNTIDEQYLTAEDKLKEEVPVKYEELHTTTGVMKRMVGSKKAPENLAFISESTYELLCDEYKDKEFEENTKIVHTVELEIESTDIAKRANVTQEPFNIYISGIDVFGEINQVSRSDVNMIVTVNPVTKKILLTSIPRDTYINLHSYNTPDKLTHSGIYGVDETISSVEDWLGVDMNYYLRVNFTTLVDVVNAIGGIDVKSPVAFSSSIHDFDYVEGMNHLNGKQALYFARERHSFEEGDEARNANQMRVMKAILKKLLSSTTLLTKYDSLVAAIQDEIETNLSTQEISALVKMQLDDFMNWDIQTYSIHCTGMQAGTFSMGMSRMLYVADPDPDSVAEALEEIRKVMNPTEEEIAAIEAEREAKAKAEEPKTLWEKITAWLTKANAEEEKAEGSSEQAE